MIKPHCLCGMWFFWSIFFIKNMLLLLKQVLRSLFAEVTLPLSNLILEKLHFSNCLFWGFFSQFFHAITWTLMQFLKCCYTYEHYQPQKALILTLEDVRGGRQFCCFSPRSFKKCFSHTSLFFHLVLYKLLWFLSLPCSQNHNFAAG